MYEWQKKSKFGQEQKREGERERERGKELIKGKVREREFYKIQVPFKYLSNIFDKYF